MGIQTMGSQGGGGQHSHFQAIAGQGSFYSLTLNEVQSQLREPLHSMNLDELIRNVLPPEGDQTFTIDLGSSNSSLHRQGSVLLTRALSKKTVDEVWRDIQQGTYKSADLVRPSSHGKQQPTLGEMTLEDFLVKAGVVVEGSQRNLNGSTTSTGSPVAPVASTQGFHQTPHWLQQYQQQMPSLLQQQQQQTHHVPARPAALPIVPVNNIMDSSYPDTRISMSLSDTQTPGRKRVAPGEVVEKTVERRQKRMIKNRESAARSRARKQAYTNELENKVSRLEEENEMLRKQKELDKLLYNPPPLEPKYRLRRISSAPF